MIATVLLLTALASAPNVSVDASRYVNDAFAKQMTLKSFRATQFDPANQSTLSVVEFQAPDRYRVTDKRGESVVFVGDRMYIKVKTGAVVGNFVYTIVKLAVIDVPLGQYRKIAPIGAVESLGSDNIRGQMSARFRFASGDKGVEANNTVWIAEDGQILQVLSVGKKDGKEFSSGFYFSDFDNTEIRIDIPR